MKSLKIQHFGMPNPKKEQIREFIKDKPLGYDYDLEAVIDCIEEYTNKALTQLEQSPKQDFSKTLGNEYTSGYNSALIEIKRKIRNSLGERSTKG